MFWWGIVVGVVALIAIVATIVVSYVATDYGKSRAVVAAIKGGIVSAVFVTGSILLIVFGLQTAEGKRMLKSWESNVSNGMNRVVTLYDVNGQEVKKYTGKFDVDYDENRIIFDDENGLRHVIYYPTGSVTIDEVEEVME